MKTSFLTITLAALGASLIQTQALDLVRDSKPFATIVSAVPREIEPAPVKGKVPRKKQGPENDEALAARTLVEWVKKITDVELPVADKATDGVTAI